MENRSQESDDVVKVLLLGENGAGRSTLLRSLLPYAQVDNEYWLNLRFMRHVSEILNCMDLLYLKLQTSRAEEAASTIMTAVNEHHVTYQTIVQALFLWENDASFKQAYECCDAFRVHPNFLLQYFTRILYKIKMVLFQFEVRDQHRESVPISFNYCDAIIFMTAIDEYDQTLDEDPSRNRLLESLDLFERTVVSNSSLQGVPVILFLNKLNSFKEKLTTLKVPINVSGAFPDAPKIRDYNTGLQYVTDLFKQKVKKRQFIVLAKDVENTSDVSTEILESILAVFLHRNLKESGILGSTESLDAPF